MLLKNIVNNQIRQKTKKIMYKIAQRINEQYQLDLSSKQLFELSKQQYFEKYIADFFDKMYYK